MPLESNNHHIQIWTRLDGIHITSLISRSTSMPDPGPQSLIRRGNRGSGKKEAPVLSVLHDRLKWTAERLRRHFSKNNPARAGVVQQNPGAGLWTAEKHRLLGTRRALVDLCPALLLLLEVHLSTAVASHFVLPSRCQCSYPLRAYLRFPHS